MRKWNIWLVMLKVDDSEDKAYNGKWEGVDSYQVKYA